MKTNIDNNIQKMILKLRHPLHISYISENILRTNMFETQEIINELIYDGVIIESTYGNGYYVVKSEMHRK